MFSQEHKYEEHMVAEMKQCPVKFDAGFVDDEDETDKDSETGKIHRKRHREIEDK